MRRSWQQEWGWPLFTIEIPVSFYKLLRELQKYWLLVLKRAHSWSPPLLAWVIYLSCSLVDLRHPILSCGTCLRPFVLALWGLSATSHRPKFTGVWSGYTASITMAADDRLRSALTTGSLNATTAYFNQAATSAPFIAQWRWSESVDVLVSIQQLKSSF